MAKVVSPEVKKKLFLGLDIGFELLTILFSFKIGINSFKVFMAYKDVFMLRDDEIIECFKVRRNIFNGLS